MVFAYEFDIFGILYTAIAAVLFAALVAAFIVFCVRKAPCGRGTVAFRALDIILLAILAAVWCVYILIRIGIFSLSGEGFSFYSGGEVIFTVPGCVNAYFIAHSVLGTLLLGAVTAFCIADLILAFALRRKVPSASAEPLSESEEFSPYGSPAPYSAAETAFSVSAPENTGHADAADEKERQSEESAEAHAAEEIIKEETSERPAEEISAEEETAAERETAEERLSEECADKPETLPEDDRAMHPSDEPPAEIEAEECVAEQPADEQTELTAAEPPEEEHKAEEVPAGREEGSLSAGVEEFVPAASGAAERERQPRRDSSVITGVRENPRATSRKKYASALQRPGTKKNVRSAAEIEAEATARDEEERQTAEERIAAPAPGPLPITRRLVITNRMNVVNMYNEYLREKKAHENEKISASSDEADRK